MIGDPVRILHRDDVKGLLVVEKPGSMPVSVHLIMILTQHQASHICIFVLLRNFQIHPTGRYNYNTLLSILKFDYDLPLVHSEFLAWIFDHDTQPKNANGLFGLCS